MPNKTNPTTAPQSKDIVQLIAFDFDGTITTEDTFALFLRYWAGTPAWVLKLLVLSPVFIAYVLKIIDRNAVKAHVIRHFFKNADAATLQNRADQFAEEIIPKLIRPGALETLKQKKKSPYTLYIVSASIEPYLLSWAKNHGIHNVLSTKLSTVNSRLTGEIEGINCWGQGKIDKIASEMSDTPYKIVEAYGDTRGDREMLHAAEESFWLPFRL